MSDKKKTLIIGASTNADRYSYKAAERLLNSGHEIELVSIKKGELFGHTFHAPLTSLSNIGTVTLYINENLQKEYYEYIISLKPGRVIFNPGTENSEFKSMLENENIEGIENCTLVMLSLGIY